ncbi:MAG: pyridoxamine 5'-phosphate oxidase family protein [Anaerolineae bacterium]
MKLTIPKPTRPRMQNYGIDENSAGLLVWDWVLTRLTDAPNYWIATTRSDARPHVAPVWGVVLDDAVYFATDAHSVKGRNLQANPQLVLHLESGFEVVIVEGVAQVITDRAVLERLTPIYARKYVQHNYEPTVDELAGNALYCVVPDVVMAWIESDFPNTATRWHF